MKFDAAQITKVARETGFPADNLEKVLRLRELLTELHKHPFLSGNEHCVNLLRDFGRLFINLAIRPPLISGS